MKVFVVGSINVDLVIQTENIPENGETVIGKSFFKNAGGKGANQAVAISKAGIDVNMVGCLGNEFSDVLIESLKDANVNITNINRVDDVSSGVAVILVSDGDNRIVIDPGANFRITKEQVDLALKSANKGDVVLMQFEIEPKIIEYTMKLARSKGLITVFNPAPAIKIDNKIFKNVDYLILNQTETLYYSGIYPRNFKEAIVASKELIKLGAKNILITLGEMGSVFYNKKEEVKVSAYLEEAVDTTSAGDTYIGYFVAGLINKKTIEESMREASAASAICIKRAGAQTSIPEISEVLEYVKCKNNT